MSNRNHSFKHRNSKSLRSKIVTSTGFQLEQISVLCSEGEYLSVSIVEKNPIVAVKAKSISFDLSVDDMENIGSMLINRALEIKNNRSAFI